MTKYRVVVDSFSYMPMKKVWYWPLWQYFRDHNGLIKRFSTSTNAIEFCRNEERHTSTGDKVIWESHPPGELVQHDDII